MLITNNDVRANVKCVTSFERRHRCFCCLCTVEVAKPTWSDHAISPTPTVRKGSNKTKTQTCIFCETSWTSTYPNAQNRLKWSERRPLQCSGTLRAYSNPSKNNI